MKRSAWVFLVIALLVSRTAGAASPSDTDESRVAAARAFDDGTRDYKAGRFRDAAEAFERAYRTRPHPDALWNAARAWERAGDLVRAANDYESYIRFATDDAPDRRQATTSLDDLAKQRLGRLEIAAAGSDGISLDGAPLASVSTYVMPGSHVVEARFGDRIVRRTATFDVGIAITIRLDPPSPSPAAPAPVVVAPVPAPHPAASGISPAFAIAGMALTAVGVGAVIGSGLDTIAYREHEFSDAPTTANKDEGFARERRTNILLATTAAVGLGTAAVALFFTRWHGGARRTGAWLPFDARVNF